ncbi:DNA-binding transcriptional LysR family regulator [Paraburkholderia atlantica]|uniref:DNA-binding transcriptional LysR family regulator n=1 Tax=Paraburkholderia atlantica TaxID=2654982 RepID=A0A6I1QEN8_PARAM|nr:LysR family transcriptional regulator [Paraburkholderia atlantica]MBB5418215.1 DNA-binding transcriptional LysR family regulator [Paraburkholderia atlantica]MBB5429091.1 DNA-binding transcriptional LysR family regulator [Paraburkholderia atlantica]MPW11512.1 LysR family transcriptional regulator [Paraburkholderia atlantica]NUY34121.1 LysR family transcriptional regulator [Paraburkholderia atlantica]
MSAENFNGLAAFVRAVETGSFTSAAHSLGTTPSAVSKSIARLEKRLGVRLFQRSTRAFLLSVEGQAYYEQVAPLVRGLERADEVLRSPATVSGRLRVSLPGELGRLLLDPVTRHLMTKHPELALDVSVSDRHVDLIRDGFDIAIRAGWLGDSGLHAHTIAELPLVLVAAPDYLREHGTPRRIADLAAHRHVRYRLSGRAYPVIFADGTTVAVDGVFDADSGDAMRVAALNGLGIAQILAIAVRDDLAAGRLCTVLQGHAMASVPVHALHAFGRNIPMRARVFMDFVTAQLVGWKASPAGSVAVTATRSHLKVRSKRT